MKTSVICILIFFTNCTFETHVSGVIVDETTGMPLREVLVKTVKDLEGREIKFAETKSSNDGHFDLRFSTRSTRDSKVSVELSKSGYQTNIYTCNNKQNRDTLRLRRQ